MEPNTTIQLCNSTNQSCKKEDLTEDILIIFMASSVFICAILLCVFRCKKNITRVLMRIKLRKREMTHSNSQSLHENLDCYDKTTYP